MSSLFRTVLAAVIGATCCAASSAHAQLRPMIYTEARIDASPEQTYADWLDADTVERFSTLPVKIDAVPGRSYALCFAATDCDTMQGRLLALQPGRMISFTQSAPPSLPATRRHLTSVQILFEPDGADGTRLRLFHTGFGEGDEWTASRTYFAETWPAMLDAYRKDVASRD